MGRRAVHEARSAGPRPSDRRTSFARSAAATFATGGTTVLLLALLRHVLADPGGLDQWVALAVIALGATASAVLTLGSALLMLTAAIHVVGRSSRALERAAHALTPAVLRRAVAVTLSAGVGLGVTAPATADEIDLGWAPTAAQQAETAPPTPSAGADAAGADVAEAHVMGAHVTGAPVAGADAAGVDVAGADVTGTAVAAAETAGTGTGRAAQSAYQAAVLAPAATPTVTVRAGDTLWSIAAAHLPADSRDEEIAAAWPRWFEANRTAIGPDPDLIVPGLRLTVPAPHHAPQEDS